MSGVSTSTLTTLDPSGRFFAGVYLPLEIMPERVQTISGYTPAGAAVTALGDAWAGAAPTASGLLVLAAYALVAGGLAVWRFRWE